MKKFLSLVLAAMMLVCMMPTVSAADVSGIWVGVKIGDDTSNVIMVSGVMTGANDYLSYNAATDTVTVANLPEGEEVYITVGLYGTPVDPSINIYFDDEEINGKLIIEDVAASLSGKLTVHEVHENFVATGDLYYDSAAACFKNSTVTFCEGSSFTFIDDSNPVDDSFKVNLAVYLDNSAFICDGANMVVVATDESGNIDDNTAIYASLDDASSIHVKSDKMRASANNGKDTNVAIGVMSVTVTGGELTATTQTDEDTDADDDANNIGIYCGSLTLDESGFLEVCGFNGGVGVYCESLALAGEAEVTAIVIGEGSFGVYCEESLSLQGSASLTAKTTGEDGVAVSCEGNLTLSGEAKLSVTATPTEGSSTGVSCGGNLTLSGNAELTAAAKGTSVRCLGDITLSGEAKLEATTDKNNSFAYGVYCESLTLGKNVSLEAQGGSGALYVNVAINIPAGKELQFSDDNKYLNFTSSASEEKDGGFKASPIMFMLIYKMRMSHNYAIETEASEGGRIVIEGDSSYRYNEDALYKFVPDEGYEIVSVIIDGVDMGAITEYEFINIRENHTVSAVFAEKLSPAPKA